MAKNNNFACEYRKAIDRGGAGGMSYGVERSNWCRQLGLWGGRDKHDVERSRATWRLGRPQVGRKTVEECRTPKSGELLV